MIKFLVAHHTLPNVTTAATVAFDNFLPIMSKYDKIHMTWLVYGPEKIDIPSNLNSNEISVIDIHDFSDGMDVINKIKPDVVFSSFSNNPVNYALALAAKTAKILLIGEYHSEFGTMSNQRKMLIEFSKNFFSNSVTTDNKPEQKKFLRRGIFLIYKINFLLKTHKACNANFLRIMKEFLVIIWSFYSYTKNPRRDIKFGSDLYLIFGKKIFENAIKDGYPSEKLFLCGDVRYDSCFKSLKKLKEKQISKKLRILMITTPFYEHGWWSKKQRDDIVNSIIQEITNHNDYALTVKIHPSSENLSEYQEIVNSIDSTIPLFQKGDVLQFLDDADVVISFLSSDAVFSALFLHKPIVFFNAGQYKNDLLVDKELVFECNSINSLSSVIDKASLNHSLQKKKIDIFIDDYFFRSDGLASERVAKKILELLKK
jgi:hypothetical protein